MSWALRFTTQKEGYLRKYEQQVSFVTECSGHTHTHTQKRKTLQHLLVVELVFMRGNMLYVIRHTDANVFQ
jgi:GH24 family phage-related lysozyme (muramidase)